MVCNICGCTSFKDFNGRPNCMCTECFSTERARVLQLILSGRNLIKPGARVLHFAPELGISRNIRSVPGVVHECVDIDPARYPKELGVKHLDIVRSASSLPSKVYDLIIHMHVMEHIAGNVTAVLYHLHRSLKESGKHVFSIPIFHGTYNEDLGPLTDEQRVQRFGQNDHVRRFGRDHLDVTLGMVFRLPRDYDLEAEFGREALTRFNVPQFAWKHLTSHTVFAFGKDDLLLR